MAANKKPPNAGKGRVPGVPNKITGDLKKMILQALAQADKKGGVEYLRKQAVANPKAFMSLLGRVLPLQVTGENGDPIEIIDVNQTEVARRIAFLLMQVAQQKGD